MIGAYKAKTSPVYSTFARQLSGGTHHLGCLLVYPAWLHLSPLQLPLHTQEAKNHIQLARNVKRFLQSFFSLIGHYKVPQTKIKGTQSLLILIATMGKDIKKNQRIWTVPLWSCDFVIYFISWMFKVICSNLLKSALDLGFYTQAIPVILNSPCAYNMPTVLKKFVSTYNSIVCSYFYWSYWCEAIIKWWLFTSRCECHVNHSWRSWISSLEGEQ